MNNKYSDFIPNMACPSQRSGRLFTTIRGKSIRSLSLSSILFFGVAFLLLAHLSIKAFFPNPAFWLLSISAIVILGCFVLVRHRDDFALLLILFLCAHFAFAEAQGGLWSYVFLGIIFVSVLLRYHPIIKTSSIPSSINLFLLVFALHQILGIALNPYSLAVKLQAAVIACSQIFVFYYCASIPMTPSRIKKLLSLWFTIAVWQFISGLNQLYRLISIDSPILPSFGQRKLINTVAAGTFGNSELFAEYFCIIFTFSLALLLYHKKGSLLKLRIAIPTTLAIISIASLIMGGSRSAIFLALSSGLYIAAGSLSLSVSSQSIKRIIVLSLGLLCFLLIVLSFGSFLPIDEMIADFDKLSGMDVSLISIISGESINRGPLFDLAIQRLKNYSWWIGSGYGPGLANRVSLGLISPDSTSLLSSGYQAFGADSIADYHSLYLSLPMFYGWLGSLAYIMVLVLTALRAHFCYRKLRNIPHYLIPVLLAFSVLWGIFLLDQYKISVTRNPSYFFLTWMLLGWTHSIINTVNHNIKLQFGSHKRHY